jgi:shikimate kinase
VPQITILLALLLILMNYSTIMHPLSSHTVISLPLTKPIVLVGLMGSGKSTVGYRLAKRLDLPFLDTDTEIERTIGCSISDIFAGAGEEYFRKLEQRTISELLTHDPHILATGGGAFIQPETRALIKKKSVSVWLRADLDVLLERVSRRKTRPLLETGDKREILQKLIQERYPVYAEADVVVDSGTDSHGVAVDAIISAVAAYVAQLPQEQC